MVWQCLKWNKHLGMEIGANSYSFKLVLWQQNCNIWEHLWEQDNSSEEKCLEIQPLCSEERWMMIDSTCYKRKHFDPAADRRGSWRAKCGWPCCSQLFLLCKECSYFLQQVTLTKVSNENYLPVHTKNADKGSIIVSPHYKTQSIALN